MCIPNQRIERTLEEESLLQKINFDFYKPGQTDPDPNGDAASELMHLLLKRSAIPAIRLRYFTDPNLNIGGRGKSRKEMFGLPCEAIFRQGTFAPYLKYFIFGPDLPSETIARLRQVVEDGHGSRGDLDQLRKVARSETRRLPTRARQDAHEEFFKLALEIGLDEFTAASIRDAARTAK